VVNGNILGVLAAGSVQTRYVDGFPFPITREVLERGQGRYTIYCAVCHGALGHGDGKIVERGFTRPPAYYVPRLRQAPDGYFFEVITNGLGAMPDHAAQIPPEDRWAIVAYVRVLQRSHRRYDDLTPDQRRELPARENPGQ
jgi:mono/diheme cytochrome c family protein